MNAGMDDLYREVILDHHRSPRCREPLAHPDAVAAGKNPSCGDEVSLQLSFEGDRISGISVQTAGCAIATASGSILGELLAGRTQEEAGHLAEAFRQGNLGVMDYMRLKNIESDTDMRKSIAEPGADS